jgi:hypothetical protein
MLKEKLQKETARETDMDICRLFRFGVRLIIECQELQLAEQPCHVAVRGSMNPKFRSHYGRDIGLVIALECERVDMPIYQICDWERCNDRSATLP